jgi:hypothetical protein
MYPPERKIQKNWAQNSDGKLVIPHPERGAALAMWEMFAKHGPTPMRALTVGIAALEDELYDCGPSRGIATWVERHGSPPAR